MTPEERAATLRAGAENLVELIRDNVPDCTERWTAVDLVLEALQWAEAGMTLEVLQRGRSLEKET